MGTKPGPAEIKQQASAAKQLVSTWRRPCVQPQQAGLPLEVLGLILTHMVAASSMWEYPQVVQQLCTYSLVSKNMYLAVQQHAWPKLLDMPGPKKPRSLASAELLLSQAHEGQALPASISLNAVVSAPASLTVASLKAVCEALRLDDAGKHSSLPPLRLVCSLCRFPCFCQAAALLNSDLHCLSLWACSLE